MRSTFLAGLLLTTFLVFSKPAIAQTDSVNTRLWVLKVSPQHLFIHGYNLEIERRLSAESKHSFTFSPRYFHGNTKIVDKFSGREAGSQTSLVNGFGAEIMHRIYKPGIIRPEKKQYFAYGLNYHQFTLDYAVLGWGEVMANDGLKYYRYQWHPRQDKINRLGVVAMFGAQNSFLFDRLLTDFYGGIGYRSGNNSQPESERFNTNILDYGSSGLYLTVGFKLGYSF